MTCSNYPQLTWQFTDHGDWICPDGVGVEDLVTLTSCWIEVTQSPADINSDDAVNLADYVRLSQVWLMTGCGVCGGADINSDDSVDDLDLALMMDHWLLMENTGCRMKDLNADGKVDLDDWAVFAEYWLEET